jgi:hypothetical protein
MLKSVGVANIMGQINIIGFDGWKWDERASYWSQITAVLVAAILAALGLHCLMKSSQETAKIAWKTREQQVMAKRNSENAVGKGKRGSPMEGQIGLEGGNLNYHGQNIFGGLGFDRTIDTGIDNGGIGGIDIDLGSDEKCEDGEAGERPVGEMEMEKF